MSLSKSLRTEIGRRIPRRIGGIPYALSLDLLSRGAAVVSRVPGAPKLEIWSRNSFRLGTFTPLLSDLDLTVWFRTPPTRRELRLVLGSIRGFRGVAPWIGELNLYSAAEAQELAQVANPLELARDPELAERLGQAERSALPSEKAVFLYRMLEADFDNLSQRPSVRSAKWRGHLEALGVAPPNEISTAAILSSMLSTLGLEAAHLNAARDELKALLDHRAEGKLNALQGISDVQWAFGSNRIPYRYGESHELRPIYREVLAAQLRWEVWGLLSQFRLIDDRQGLLRHLESLQKLQAVCDPQDTETAAVLARFAELVARESAG